MDILKKAHRDGKVRVRDGNRRSGTHYQSVLLQGRVILLLVLALLGNVHTATPQSIASKSYDEYDVKAAFLFKVALFVEWPQRENEDQEDPFVITILGEDPFKEKLNRWAPKTVKNRAIEIRRIRKIDELKPCHVLYISPSEKSNLAKIQKKIKSWNVLTVSDYQGFAEAGGMINLMIQRNRLVFKINPHAAEQERLKMSSRLLSLAYQIVHTNEEKGPNS